MTVQERDEMQARIERFGRLNRLADQCKALADDLAKGDARSWCVTFDHTAGDPTGLQTAVADVLAEHAAELRKLADAI